MKSFSPYGKIFSVANGKQAIYAFRVALEIEEPFDLVCLDIMMPAVDGQTLLKTIRRLEASKTLNQKGV